MTIHKFLDENFDISQNEIKTDYGTIHLTLVKNRMELLKHISLIALDKQHLSDKLFEIDNNKEIWKILDKNHIFKFLQMMRDLKFEVFGLYDLYLKVKKAFKYVFQEDIFDKIETVEDYEFLVDLICEVNGFANKKKSKNKEIAYYDSLKSELDKAKNGNINYESIYTTVWAFTGQCPNNMTLYQLNCLFSRIATMKNYDTSIATAVAGAGNKVKIIPYYATIDKGLNDEKIISKDSLGKQNKHL